MMPQVFADSGYRTAIFGKWHLGDSYPFRPQDRGFHEVLIHGGGGVGQIPDYWGNDYFDDTYFMNGQPRKFEGYCTDIFFRGALEFIEANQDRPFFVYLPTNAPHGPFRVAEQYSEPYREKVGEDAELAKFYGMIANIDKNVGTLLARLEELDLADNTIVVVWGDHGWSLGDHTLWSKHSTFDIATRSALVVSAPGMSRGAQARGLVEFVDLYPTVSELAGLEVPDHVQGESFADLLIDPDTPGKQAVFPRWQNADVIRTERYSYTEWRDEEETVTASMLYDHKRDPGETRNVVEDAAYADDLAVLQQQLAEQVAAASQY